MNMVTWDDVKSLIGKSAPVLGGILGGPGGAAVGALVSSALGTSNTPDAVAAALQSDPNALLKLKQLEVNFAQSQINASAQNDAGQLQVDLAAEQSASTFQKWRDGLGWIGVAGLGYAFLVQPILSWIAAIWFPSITTPKLDSATLMSLVITLLGATTAHVVENVKDAYHV
jgi:hypothetical protein